MSVHQDPNALTMLIAGKRVGAANGATFERRNPLDGEVASRAPAATLDDARAAVHAAWDAFPAWSNTGPGERLRFVGGFQRASRRARAARSCRDDDADRWRDHSV